VIHSIVRLAVFLVLLCTGLLCTGSAFAATPKHLPQLEGRWKIVGYSLTSGIGAYDDAGAKKLVGSTQELMKGFASGVLFTCDGGLAYNYVYLSDSEARVTGRDVGQTIADYRIRLNGTGLFVHTLTCGRVDHVVYQLGDSGTLYYVIDGAAFRLRKA
jgi:hypothetical protein